MGMEGGRMGMPESADSEEVVPANGSEEMNLESKQLKENAYQVTHVLRTLTEGGFQKNEDARRLITEFLETSSEGKDSDVMVPLRRVLDVLPEDGYAKDEATKKVFEDAWSAVNEYRKKNNLEYN